MWTVLALPWKLCAVIHVSQQCSGWHDWCFSCAHDSGKIKVIGLAWLSLPKHQGVWAVSQVMAQSCGDCKHAANSGKCLGLSAFQSLLKFPHHLHQHLVSLHSTCPLVWGCTAKFLPSKCPWAHTGHWWCCSPSWLLSHLGTWLVLQRLRCTLATGI